MDTIIVTRTQIKRARILAKEKQHSVLSSGYATAEQTHRSFTVTAETRQVPHTVSFVAPGVFYCDERCEAFNYTHVCSHIGAVLNFLYAHFITQAEWNAFLTRKVAAKVQREADSIVDRAEKPLYQRPVPSEPVDSASGKPAWMMR